MFKADTYVVNWQPHYIDYRRKEIDSAAEMLLLQTRCCNKTIFAAESISFLFKTYSIILWILMTTPLRKLYLNDPCLRLRNFCLLSRPLTRTQRFKNSFIKICCSFPTLISFSNLTCILTSWSVYYYKNILNCLDAFTWHLWCIHRYCEFNMNSSCLAFFFLIVILSSSQST